MAALRKPKSPQAAKATPQNHTIQGPLGGQVGLWQEEIERRLMVPETLPPTERVVQTISRLSGPAALVAAIGGLVYLLAT